MLVGVPKEIKDGESRVALTPAGARELTRGGHDVLVEEGAGERVGLSDGDYESVGATVTKVDHLYEKARLILKVKEPQPEEVERLDPKHVLFTYLHLAASPSLAATLANTGATCIAYETIESPTGRLPLLAPMSAIAGRVAGQAAAVALNAPAGGPGKLIGGAVGVPPAEVVVVGCGVAGTEAADVVLGMGARVTLVDLSPERLQEARNRFGGRVRTMHSDEATIEALLPGADIVIGAALVKGTRAPLVLHRTDLSRLGPGSILVDIAIDQGGCFESSLPTTHAKPTFIEEGVIHYCVTNMPAAAPVTSTHALTAATQHYVINLADLGPESVREADAALSNGVNVMDGEIVHPAVREAVLS